MRQHLIRNIFDQYRHSENRLTHALIHVLAGDARLTRDFVKFATGSPAPKGASLCLSCQLLPGEEGQRAVEEDYAERRGLPDAWIYDERLGWAVICESKITASLTTKQLVRHVITARKRGFQDTHLLVITAHESSPAAIARLPRHVSASWIGWPDIFDFFTRHAGSKLESEFVSYMRVLEAQLMADGYQGSPLTKFTGIPFGAAYPYNEAEAKVVLRALMRELRRRLADSRVLPIDPMTQRPAMTGTWDIVGFRFASPQEFTREPHLTVVIGDGASIQLTLPNNARPEYWRRLRSVSRERLGEALVEVAEAIRPVRHHVERDLWEPRLTLDLLQRHFYARREETLDGFIQFDVDVLLDSERKVNSGVKKVQAWLDAVHVMVAQSHRANFQLELSVRFPHSDRSVCRGPQFVDALVASAEALEPFLALLLD